MHPTDAVDRRDLRGPFDLIGDTHGCLTEFDRLLHRLGHMRDGRVVRHGDGRIPVLLGDLTDRGPRNLDTLRRAQELKAAGGLVLIGNHCRKVMLWLRGESVRVGDSLSGTVAELSALAPEERAALADWIAALPHHLVLDGGRLVAAHAGLPAHLHLVDDEESRFFSLYGAATGTFDADGLPNATEWAHDYDGEAIVVHGHVVRDEPRWTGRVCSIDTGCVYGGSLTALRYPELETVQVEADRVHFASSHGRPGRHRTVGGRTAA